MAENETKKFCKRSSLKGGIQPLTEKEIKLLQKDNRRNSVSWNLAIASSQKIKDIRTSFKEMNLQTDKERKINEEKKKKFFEERKKNAKNEYLNVKELLKNKQIIEEEEDEEMKEAKENTKKNIEICKNIDEESDSRSENSNN